MRRITIAFVSLLLVAGGPAFAGGKSTTYKPMTKYDNTPYRFNMTEGKSAQDFDAWMKSRGIRVAKGRPVKRVRAKRVARK